MWISGSISPGESRKRRTTWKQAIASSWLPVAADLQPSLYHCHQRGSQGCKASSSQATLTAAYGSSGRAAKALCMMMRAVSSAGFAGWAEANPFRNA